MSLDTAPDLESARAQRSRNDDAKPAFPPGTSHFPLTIAQTPIALDAMALPNSPVANTGDIAHIRGRIDTGLFAAAVRRVVAETEAIRVSLVYRDGALLQEFPALDDYVLEQLDLSAAAQPERSAEGWIEDHFWTPRPWNSFPLFQFALLKIGDGHFIFVQKFHHVLADATGRFQCFARITDVYEALVHGVEPPPSPSRALTVRIAEDAAYLDSEAYQADLAYWTNRLGNLSEPLVDADRSKSERGRSGRSKRLSYAIAPDDFAQLKQRAAALGASVPRLVLALTYISIARLYGMDHIVIGTPGHNRATQAAKRSIDLAMTVMPFLMTFESGVTLAQMLKDIARLQVADRRHGKFPFASLRRLTGNQEAGTALSDIMVNYIPAMEDISLSGADVTYSNHSAGFYLPLVVDLRETNNGLGAKLTIAFDPGLVDAEDGARLARCLHFLLTNPADFSQHTIGKIPIISDAERRHLLIELNDTDMPVPADATLASLCARQAELTPDSIAAIHGTQSITYAQLHARADLLALHLRAAGVGPEIIVGVALPRNFELLTALLAIHKAGGAYLPLDLALPADRIAYIITDAQARIIVTTRALAQQLPQTRADLVFLDDPALAAAPASTTPELFAARPENLAYVIYTSGSTGLPKGVAVEHRNAANLVLFQATQLEPDDSGGILFSSSLNFDASIDELFVSLVSGGRLIIVETLLAYPAAPAHNEVRVLETAPSVFEALLQINGFRPGIRRIRFGGEALPRSLVDRVLAIDPNIRIINSYGPTETTVDATVSKVRPSDSGEPPIGKGLWNTKLYVLDQNRELLPKGAKGELYIGGAGVARGYLGKPDLTAERFVENPFGEGRLYRTGDIVCWRQDGELDFCGRIDAQVKISGLRIELDEIQKQLESIPGIAGAAVIVRPDSRGIKRIFAFAVPRDMKNRPDLFAVNSYLDGKLPRYMVPAALTWIEKLPLTSSGKLDKNALSMPSWEKPKSSYRAPSNEHEACLAFIWSEVLKVPKIGIDEDYFELGGTSLQAVMIFARIAQDYGLDMPAITMVRTPTIARQAALLREALHTNINVKLTALRDGGRGLPLFFVHGAGGGVMYVRDIMQDLRCKNPLYGLQPPPLDGTERLPRSMEKIAATYIDEIRKVQPAGPYHIAGYSTGGTIAYEMAQQLMRAGQAVAFLGLIETDVARYKIAREQQAARTAEHRRNTNQNATILTIAKRVARTILDRVYLMRSAAGEIPNELRYALGISIPHNDRMSFYIRKFVKAENNYWPKRYPGVVTLFTREITLDRHTANWSKLAGGGLIVQTLPVDGHLDIVLLPNSRFVAMRIDACLKALGSRELPADAP